MYMEEREKNNTTIRQRKRGLFFTALKVCHDYCSATAVSAKIGFAYRMGLHMIADKGVFDQLVTLCSN